MSILNMALISIILTAAHLRGTDSVLGFIISGRMLIPTRGQSIGTKPLPTGRPYPMLEVEVQEWPAPEGPSTKIQCKVSTQDHNYDS